MSSARNPFFGELAIMLWLLIKGANPLRAEVSSA